MKSSLPALLIFFSLILGSCMVNARREPEKYWKAIMKDEAMPKALTDLLLEPSQSTETEGQLRSFKKSNMGKFIRNFDVQPNVILYHSKEHGLKKTTEHQMVEN